VFWCSFSAIRSGSVALSPIKSGSSRARAAATRGPGAKALPWPVIPPSVCTAIRVWIESPGLISVDQPPLGLSP